MPNNLKKRGRAIKTRGTVKGCRAVVLAMLVVQPPQTSETRGSNPVIAKFYFLSTVLKRQR